MITNNHNGFIKIPKSLLYNDKFKNLSNSSKVLLLYILALSNSTRNEMFYCSHIEIENTLQINRIKMWRLGNELKKLKIIIKSKKNVYYFNLTKFYQKWTEIATFN